MAYARFRANSDNYILLHKFFFIETAKAEFEQNQIRGCFLKARDQTIFPSCPTVKCRW